MIHFIYIHLLKEHIRPSHCDAATVMTKYNLKLVNILNDCKFSMKKACLTDVQASDMFKNNFYPEASTCAS